MSKIIIACIIVAIAGMVVEIIARNYSGAIYAALAASWAHSAGSLKRDKTLLERQFQDYIAEHKESK